MSEVIEQNAPAIEQEFIDQAKGYESLGPQYFAARKIAEAFMVQFQAEHFEALIEKAAGDFRQKMWDSLHDYLLGDTESNLHTSIWRQIDGSVEALLSGEEWALQRYALGSRYDHEKVRAAVAKHIPQELQDKRIADLEAQLAQAQENLRFARERY
jgi:hypothetical protein